MTDGRFGSCVTLPLGGTKKNPTDKLQQLLSGKSWLHEPHDVWDVRQKEGNTIFWLRWNEETTLGKKDGWGHKTNMLWWSTRNHSLQERVGSSETLKDKAMSARKITFPRHKNQGNTPDGFKWWFLQYRSTTLRSHQVNSLSWWNNTWFPVHRCTPRNAKQWVFKRRTSKSEIWPYWRTIWD